LPTICERRAPGREPANPILKNISPSPSGTACADTEPTEEIDPTLNWDERRRRYEALKAEQNTRGAELV
jgi:hypothetical protein